MFVGGRRPRRLKHDSTLLCVPAAIRYLGKVIVRCGFIAVHCVQRMYFPNFLFQIQIRAFIWRMLRSAHEIRVIFADILLNAVNLLRGTDAHPVRPLLLLVLR